MAATFDLMSCDKIDDVPDDFRIGCYTLVERLYPGVLKLRHDNGELMYITLTDLKASIKP